MILLAVENTFRCHHVDLPSSATYYTPTTSDTRADRAKHSALPFGSYYPSSFSVFGPSSLPPAKRNNAVSKASHDRFPGSATQPQGRKIARAPQGSSGSATAARLQGPAIIGQATVGNANTSPLASTSTPRRLEPCIDPQLLDPQLLPEHPAVPDRTVVRPRESIAAGTQVIKRPAKPQTTAESSKKPRLSISTASQTGAAEPSHRVSSPREYTSSTSSQDGESLCFTFDDARGSHRDGTSVRAASPQVTNANGTVIETISRGSRAESTLAAVLAQLGQLTSERDALRASEETLKTERNNLKGEAGRLAKDRKTLEERLSKIGAHFSEQQDRAERAERRGRELETQLEPLRAQAEKSHDLQSALTRTTSRAELAEHRVQQLVSERDALLIKLRASENEVAVAKDAANRVDARWQAEAKEVTDRFNDLESRLQASNEKIETMNGQLTQVVHERDSLLQGVYGLLYPDAESGPVEFSDILRSLEAEMTRLRDDAPTAKQRALDAEQRLIAAEEERATMEDKHDRRAAYITILRQRIAELEASSWRF
ncbi:unnamed protein product [Peniophora sp. CBMAI 1063]|nr:unnamed protein product [Peniophora sp. CBMAI 1063]